MKQNREEVLRIDKDVEFKNRPLFQNSEDVFFRVIWQQSGKKREEEDY